MLVQNFGNFYVSRRSFFRILLLEIEKRPLLQSGEKKPAFTWTLTLFEICKFLTGTGATTRSFEGRGSEGRTKARSGRFWSFRVKQMYVDLGNEGKKAVTNTPSSWAPARRSSQFGVINIRSGYSIEHDSYIRPQTVKLIIPKEENLECLIYFKTQPGPVAKNATLELPAGNWTRDLANLVGCSGHWATKAVAESMGTSSVFYKVWSITDWPDGSVVKKQI